MKICTKCGKHEAPENHSHCVPCRSAYLKDYRDRVGSSVKGPFPWPDDPISAPFRQWIAGPVSHRKNQSLGVLTFRA